VVAGTATAVSNRVSRRQYDRWAEQEAAQAPPPQPAPAAPAPAGGGTDAMIDQLKQLGELKAAGVLTEAEFEVQKARILAGG
jgi:hypothetical protein